MFRATVSGGRFATRTSHDDNTRSSHNEGTFARIMRHETREAKDGQTEEKTHANYKQTNQNPQIFYHHSRGNAFEEAYAVCFLPDN